MILNSNSLRLPVTAVALLTLAWTAPAFAARAKPKDDCSSRETALARTLCGDPEVAEFDKWVAEAYMAAVAKADKATKQSLQRDQKAFLRDRDECLPKAPAAAAVAKASESEGASISELPPESRAPDALTPETRPPEARADGAVPTSPDAGDTQKPADLTRSAATPGPDDASAAAPAAADADAGSDDDAPPSPEETLACLRTAYQGRIAALETMLRRFVDLSSVVPNAGTICAAVDALQKQGKLRLLPRHALVLTPVDEADEMHPSLKMAHLARYMTQDAAKAAADTVAVWNSGLGAVSIYRAPIQPGRPPIWVFSTLAGKDRDRNVLLFEGDDRMADQLVGFLGGEGAGPFDPLFVRFRGQTFAAEQVGPTYSTAPAPGIYALDQSKPVCPAGVAKPTG